MPANHTTPPQVHAIHAEWLLGMPAVGLDLAEEMCLAILEQIC
jgi:hypothetical protein